MNLSSLGAGKTEPAKRNKKIIPIPVATMVFLHFITLPHFPFLIPPRASGGILAFFKKGGKKYGEGLKITIELDVD